MARWAKLRVLGEPTYRRLWIGRTASLVGDGIAPIALAFGILGLTGSATDLGIVLASHSLVLIALILVGGVVADRVSPRLSMLGADLVRTVAVGLIAALLLAGVAEIWELVALYAIDGAATAFFNPASDAIVPQLVPRSRLQEANALLNFSRWAGKVAGPALAGVLLALGSPGLALAVDAATFAVSAACLWSLRGPAGRPLREKQNFFGDLRHGWREFSIRRWAVAIVLSAAVTNALFTPIFLVLGPLVARESLGGSSSWALIASLFGAGGLVGGAVALSIRPRRPLLVSESIALLFALPIFLLAIPASTATIAVGAGISGAIASVSEILYMTVVAQKVPQESLSRVMAYDWFGSLALEPLALALIGPLAIAIGTSTTLWLGATAITACIFAALLVPSVRRLEFDGTEPIPTPPPLPIEAGD
ncbi:MAG TPA: MFS transporter [Solirubrobacterales bacterium]|nr:MFS transporter [Solirubrobacterales bacterium]